MQSSSSGMICPVGRLQHSKLREGPTPESFEPHSPDLSNRTLILPFLSRKLDQIYRLEQTIGRKTMLGSRSRHGEFFSFNLWSLATSCSINPRNWFSIVKLSSKGCHTEPILQDPPTINSTWPNHLPMLKITARLVQQGFPYLGKRTT